MVSRCLSNSKSSSICKRARSLCTSLIPEYLGWMLMVFTFLSWCFLNSSLALFKFQSPQRTLISLLSLQKCCQCNNRYNFIVFFYLSGHHQFRIPQQLWKSSWLYWSCSGNVWMINPGTPNWIRTLDSSAKIAYSRHTIQPTGCHCFYNSGSLCFAQLWRYMAPRKGKFWLFLAILALFGWFFFVHLYPSTVFDKSLQ